MDTVTVHAMILKRRAVGDYDYALTLLSAEQGKLSAFARGARRMNARLSGNVEPFVYGTFLLYPGKSAYSVQSVNVSNYFEGFRTNLEAACYASFFAEVADYYSRENDDNKELLHLLYVSLLALLKKDAPFSLRLVRATFEIRALLINGEYPGPPGELRLKPDTVYALAHITEAPLKSLYTFNVSEAVEKELSTVCRLFRDRFLDRSFKSLEMITSFEV